MIKERRGKRKGTRPCMCILPFEMDTQSDKKNLVSYVLKDIGYSGARVGQAIFPLMKEIFACTSVILPMTRLHLTFMQPTKERVSCATVLILKKKNEKTLSSVAIFTRWFVLTWECPSRVPSRTIYGRITFLFICFNDAFFSPRTSVRVIGMHREIIHRRLK